MNTTIPFAIACMLATHAPMRKPQAERYAGQHDYRRHAWRGDDVSSKIGRRAGRQEAMKRRLTARPTGVDSD